jgi:hypothetical protein
MQQHTVVGVAALVPALRERGDVPFDAAAAGQRGNVAMRERGGTLCSAVAIDPVTQPVTPVQPGAEVEIAAARAVGAVEHPHRLRAERRGAGGQRGRQREAS